MGLRTSSLRLAPVRAGTLAAFLGLAGCSADDPDPSTVKPPQDSGAIAFDGASNGADANAQADAGSAGDTGAVDAGAKTSFTAVFDIVQSSCAGCHTTGASGGMQLGTTKATVHAGLVNANATCGGKRIVPNDPQASLFYEKVNSSTPRCGGRMPLGGALPAADIKAIEDWINEGAPNN